MEPIILLLIYLCIFIFSLFMLYLINAFNFYFISHFFFHIFLLLLYSIFVFNIPNPYLCSSLSPAGISYPIKTYTQTHPLSLHINPTKTHTNLIHVSSKRRTLFSSSETHPNGRARRWRTWRRPWRFRTWIRRARTRR